MLEEDKLEKDKEVINLDKKNKIAESEIDYNNINKVYKENTITAKEKEEDLNDLKNVLNRLRPIGIIFQLIY